MNEHAGLPTEPIDPLTRAFWRFLHFETTAGVFLVASSLCAVAISNSPWSQHFEDIWTVSVGLSVGDYNLSRSVRHWINDGLMTLFFFVIALELKREIVLGELRNPGLAALSLAGALGGMIVPVALYFLLLGSDGPEAAGWGVVMATDTAFVIGCLALLGSRVPLSLRLFLLSLAIFDDVGAIVVVAIGYSDELSWPALAAGCGGLLAIALTARLGIRGFGIYFAIGLLVWLAVDMSGVHATVVGVAIGLMTPARGWISDTRLRAILDRLIAHPLGDHWSGDTEERSDLQRARVAARETLSPVERLEMLLQPWVAFLILPLFALANAGVRLDPSAINWSLGVAIVVGLVVGKPIGILVLSWSAVRLRFAARPQGLSWNMIGAGSILTGIGFTMSLFVADLAFEPAQLASAKAGVLVASVVAGSSGLLALLLASRKKAYP